MHVGEGRGQSTVLGFVLLFGLLMLVLTIHQTTVVPDQNAEVELQHHESVVQDFRTVRQSAFDAARHGGTSPTTVDLGTRYPPRLVALNPPPATGSLHTAAAGEIGVTVDSQQFGLSQLCGYEETPVTTRSLVYDPSYNVLTDMPSVVYGNTVVARTQGGQPVTTETNQAIVSDNTVTFLPVTGQVERSGTSTVSLDLKGGPVNSTQVSASSELQLSFPSTLPPSTWSSLLADESQVTSVDRAGENRITVTLASGDYTMACAAVGLDEAPPSGVASIGAPPVGEGGADGTSDTSDTGGEATGPQLSGLTIDDQSTRRNASFTLDYRTQNLSDGNLEVTFQHPTRRSATETYTRTTASGTIQYHGGLFSAQNDSGEPATYTITVEVYDAQGRLVDEVSFEERADGDGSKEIV